MLGTELPGTKDATATVAVKDLKRAKEFYGGTLGLTADDTGQQEVLSYESGNSSILVYKSNHAGTNKATSVTWVVGDDLNGIVQALRSKGVAFEHYDMPGMKREGDVHVSGGMKAAWFKDPDGNILCIVNG
jgi:catechol 2,3-dioxygenase-like lactoylglutathione lyase family enzyme